MGVEYVSYSRLSTLDKGPFLFKRKYIDGIQEERDSKALSLGSAVDCLLTTPDKFYELFIVSTITKPTGQMGDYIDYLVKFSEEENCEQLAYEAAGFKRDSLDKVKERFTNEGKEYYDFLLDSKEKAVLSFEDYTKAQNIAVSFKTGKYTEHLFTEQLGIERHYQYPFELYVPLIDRTVKGMIDILDIDHERKHIVITDVKTTSKSVLSFGKEVFEWRYDIQAFIYYMAMDCAFPDYTIHMQYAVENSEYPNLPVIWKMPLYYITSHAHYEPIVYNNREYKTVKQLLKELKHYEAEGFNEYYESYVNNGKFTI
jgi:hypothetical protein